MQRGRAKIKVTLKEVLADLKPGNSQVKILHLGILGSCSPFPRVSRSAPSLEQKALRPLLTIIITITIIIVIIIITITIMTN